MEEVVAFTSSDPATWTSSELMNALCRAIEKLGAATPGKDIAAYMGLNYTKLNGAIEIICGSSILKVKYAILEKKLFETRAEHQYWSLDKLAKSVGLYDQSSLRRTFSAETYNQLAPLSMMDEKRRLLKEFENFVREHR